MPRDYHDHREWEAQSGEAARPRFHWRGPPGKDSFSTLKDYVFIILLAVLVFNGVNNFILGGGCAMTGRGAAVSAEQLQQMGLEYYAARYGYTAVEAEVRDFGCHQEIYILKDGQLVLRLAYRGCELYELPEV
jgi:hypothetical protein